MAGRRLIVSLLLILCLTVEAEAATLPLIIKLSPASHIGTVLSALGGVLVDSIPGTNTFLINAPFVPSSLLASLLGILSVETNTALKLPPFLPLGVLTVPPNTPPDWYKNQPLMVHIHSLDALPYSTGRSIVVADINSRVDIGHPALVGHLTAGYDFVANQPVGTTAVSSSSLDQSSSSFMDQSSSSFMDQFFSSFVVLSSTGLADSQNPAYSHGTLCAGVIAIIAPDSMIMPLRVFDDDGGADTFNIAKAMYYAVQNGAHVINMSFGTLQDSVTLKDAVTFALSRNVVLVASAGNNNTSSPQYPAAYDGVLTTAATDLADHKGSFSNYGNDIFVDAPGVNVFSAYPGGYYSIVSGTSFSAPIIAGTAALIRSLRSAGVSNSVAGGAVNIDPYNPGYAQQLGYGRIDVLHAVQPN